MTLFLSLCTLAGALAIGAMSPGPAFVFVVQTSMSGSRRDGLAAALGMGLGAVGFAILVMVGMQAVLAQVAWLFVAIKTAGAIYLVTLAINLWMGAGRTLNIDGKSAAVAGGSAIRAFWRALLTQLSNPKALVVYGSVFAALLPRDLPRPVALGLPVVVLIIETGWYAVVALALSTTMPRRTYLQWKPVIDRLCAGILGALGLRLLFVPVSGR